MKLKRWDNQEVIFELECYSLLELLRGAFKAKISFYRADLRGANLHGANLRGADLRDAVLYDAVLRGADLRDANLQDVDLYGANLHGANLRGADLRDADLHGADLYDAVLCGANLHGARNIISFQGGKSNRVCFGFLNKEQKPMFKIGCFYGNTQEAVLKIREKYGKYSTYERLVILYDEVLKDMAKVEENE